MAWGLECTTDPKGADECVAGSLYPPPPPRGCGGLILMPRRVTTGDIPHGGGGGGWGPGYPNICACTSK